MISQETTLTESIATRTGSRLLVEKRIDAHGAELTLRRTDGRRCVLHWGVRTSEQSGWRAPPNDCWPEGTKPAGRDAVQTPFARRGGESRVVIRLSGSAAHSIIEFVLFFPDGGQWDNNGGRNYQIAVPAARRSGVAPLARLREQCGKEELVLERVFHVETEGELAAGVTKTGNQYRILLVTDVKGPLILHWGIARRSPHEWLAPPESLRPADTVLIGGHTAQTPFAQRGDASQLDFGFAEDGAPLGIQFVVKRVEDGHWLKDRGANFFLPIDSHLKEAGALDSAELARLADEIIRAETGSGSWTLMHRFNLCHDLLDRVRNNLEGLALLYVWLRFSAIRQLTWQRNYNTKPRELSHAQDRLTHRLADLFRADQASRPILRLMLATVGRGGEGQRIRDEILNIMHRHHVKEVSGHFLEEWHQKLHNNTTPDDLVICEAYLAFLRTDGNHDRFYETLQAGGVTRQRLESFERPIRSRPDFVPHLKGGLMHDFEHFLRTLKAVHSSTDLETAVNAARGQLDGDAQGLIGQVWDHRNDPPEALVPLVERVTESRRRLSHLLDTSTGLRELLYLDLALEQLVRIVVERNIHLRLNGDQLVDLIARVLENVTLSYEDPELGACLRHWSRLQRLPRFGAEWARHAKSVVDRVGRGLGGWMDRFHQLLQPKGEALGRGFRAEAWTITLFSEEVVRGSSLGFALSMLLHHLDPLLRQAADLGAWQIVSRGRGRGTVEVVRTLASIQGRSLDHPTVIVADEVMGDEEIPEQVTAVIAPDVTDLVSHVAVRARNARVLFASCHDPQMIDRLKSLHGQELSLEINPAGDVVFTIGTVEAAPARPHTRPARPAIRLPRITRFAVAERDFNERIAGAKSCRQARLRGRLPEWIRQPPSVAVPFGVFEKVLSSRENKEASRRYQELASRIDVEGLPGLNALRETIGSLAAPAKLKTALHETMTAAGLPWPDDWEAAWSSIKQVWASKWNERAFLSRRAVGLDHEDLFMAVLIQPVVPADHAFVIHTTNPSTANAQELYAEVVVGLGETLVGNHPGRALSFVWNKPAKEASVVTFPSKSAALSGDGLIFRSDSNGEDLAGYAGAGLYDSVLLPTPRLTLLDYAEEPLVWDEDFRGGMLESIARMGVEVENALGSPQDIEGGVADGQYYLLQTRPQAGLDHA